MSGERLGIRDDILKIVTSDEAGRVTLQLSRIYLQLVHAPSHFWEGEAVIRLTGEVRKGQYISPWNQLLALTKVSPRTARKAIVWLVSKRVITFHTPDDKSEIVITFEGIEPRK